MYGGTGEDFVQTVGSAGQFFNADEDRSTIHVYSSGYEEDQERKRSEEMTDTSQSQTPLMSSGNSGN